MITCAFYIRRLQTLCIDQIARSKATCPFNILGRNIPARLCCWYSCCLWNLAISRRHYRTRKHEDTVPHFKIKLPRANPATCCCSIWCWDRKPVPDSVNNKLSFSFLAGNWYLYNKSRHTTRGKINRLSGSKDEGLSWNEICDVIHLWICVINRVI